MHGFLSPGLSSGTTSPVVSRSRIRIRETPPKCTKIVRNPNYKVSLGRERRSSLNGHLADLLLRSHTSDFFFPGPWMGHIVVLSLDSEDRMWLPFQVCAQEPTLDASCWLILQPWLVYRAWNLAFFQLGPSCCM